MTNRSRSVWITGANGFLGRHVGQRFARAGAEVAGFGRSEWQSAAQWGFRRWICSDDLVRALEEATDTLGTPDLIFHAAGTPTVAAAAADPAAASEITVDVTSAILDLAIAWSARPVFLFPSSCSVYGHSVEQPLTEEMPAAPVSVYGEHKARAEEACRRAAACGLNVGVIRYFSIYGRGLRKQLLWDLASKIMLGGGEICLDGTGRETRDFLEVDDAAELAFVVAETCFDQAATPFLLVNGSTGIPCSVAEVAALGVETLRPSTGLVFSGRTRPGDPMQYVGDTARARGLGFEPRWAPRQGMARYFLWARDQMETADTQQPTA